MVKLVFCVLQVIILFYLGVCSGKIEVRGIGFHVDGEGHRYLDFICTAYGETGDELSWYHTIGSNNEVLATSNVIDSDKVMKISLSLILSKEYNNTSIFCVKRRSRGEPSWIESDPIKVTFQKASKPEVKPFVTVTPDTSPALFDVNDTLKFFCNGSKPLYGKNLSWYIQGPDSKPVYANYQMYDNKTNVNNLELHLNESYNGALLYCAQSYVLHHYDDQGKPYEEGHGSTVTSKNITLLQRRKREKNENRTENKGKDVDNNRKRDKGPEGDPKGDSDETDASNTEENKEDPKGGSSPLVYAIPIGVIALLVVLAAAVWLYRRWRAPVKTPGNDENIYAIPEVQYVTLDLPNGTKDASKKINAPKQENPYAEIIGIYRPSNAQKPQ